MTKTYELLDERTIMADVDEKHHMATVSVYILDELVEAVNKTGHWIRGIYTEDNIRYNDSSYKCSKCARIVDFKENYCPNCGAKMVEPQESEKV